MSKIKKRKFNIKNILIFSIILIVLILFIVFFNKENKEILMDNLIGIKYDSLDLSKYNMEINTEYEYNNEYEDGYIIWQSINEGTIIDDSLKLELIISKGSIPLDKYKEDKINEVGNVPIMMYHGIKDMLDSETSYIGGNVDKDGYTRTQESFRRDLDFYYSNRYRMIKLSDFINGNIDCEYGYSPIILTFDDGNDNNIKVTGVDDNGNIIIDKNSAVGILEEYKKKYPDFNVTAIFFITNNLFNQPEYDELIMKWLIDNGYEIGNHTLGHNNFSNINIDKTQEVVGGMYQKLESILGDKYSKIVALPFGSPYNREHDNYKYIIDGSYNGVKYHTDSALRVGWEPEVSPFNKNFDKTFLKRCRAYDNNGVDFDIEMVFRILDSKRYISDGDIDTIVTDKKNESLINKDIKKEIILYE